MKRIFDVLLSLIMLMMIAPFLAAVAIMIKLDSNGPIFFLQYRVGRDGRIFKIIKFRSMIANAESLGSYMTATNDARITKLGRFIRRSSIDELPQLINVLAGDMSLVGPRPDVPAQRAEYTEQEWEIRHRVRPGLTGLAQATLRSSATSVQRKAMDIDYATNHSIQRDLWIILLTAKQVLFRGGN